MNPRAFAVAALLIAAPCVATVPAPRAAAPQAAAPSEWPQKATVDGTSYVLNAPEYIERDCSDADHPATVKRLTSPPQGASKG